MHDQGVSIPELIVVPGVNRAEVTVDDFGQRKVSNGRMRVTDDIGRD